MVQVSMIGYFVGGAFLGLAYFDYYYHLLAIILLTKVALENEATPGVVTSVSPFSTQVSAATPRWGWQRK